MCFILTAAYNASLSWFLILIRGLFFFPPVLRFEHSSAVYLPSSIFSFVSAASSSFWYHPRAQLFLAFYIFVWSPWGAVCRFNLMRIVSVSTSCHFYSAASKASKPGTLVIIIVLSVASTLSWSFLFSTISIIEKPMKSTSSWALLGRHSLKVPRSAPRHPRLILLK